MDDHATPPGPADALLLVGAQVAMLAGEDAVAHPDRLLRALEHLLAAAREAGALVVHVQRDGDWGDPVEAGSPGWRLALASHESTSEVVVRTRRDDAFAGTLMSPVLGARGAKRIVVAGCPSETAVSATVRGALAAGLDVVVPRGAHGTHPLEDIPALTVSRVAEHTMGPAVELAAAAEAVRFGAPAGRV